MRLARLMEAAETRSEPLPARAEPLEVAWLGQRPSWLDDEPGSRVLDGLTIKSTISATTRVVHLASHASESVADVRAAQPDASVVFGIGHLASAAPLADAEAADVVLVESEADARRLHAYSDALERQDRRRPQPPRSRLACARGDAAADRGLADQAIPTPSPARTPDDPVRRPVHAGGRTRSPHTRPRIGCAVSSKTCVSRQCHSAPSNRSTSTAARWMRLRSDIEESSSGRVRPMRCGSGTRPRPSSAVRGESPASLPKHHALGAAAARPVRGDRLARVP